MTMMGRYDLHDSLGGSVYTALDRLSGQTVAYKQINTKKPFYLQKLQRLASLRHPNIMPVYDYGLDAAGQLYFTMPLLKPLPDLVTQGQPGVLHEKIKWLAKTLHVLSSLHRNGIVHGNLKPAHVRINDRAIQIVDVGLSRGTPGYIAPEVLLGDAAGPASDLFAVGVLAYELLIGKHPFLADNAEDTRANTLLLHPDLIGLLNLTLDIVAGGASDQPVANPPTLILNEATMKTMLLGDNATFAGGIDRRILQEAARMSSELYALMDILNKLLVKDPANRYARAEHVLADLTEVFDYLGNYTVTSQIVDVPCFAGRDTEVNQLRTALDQVQAGQGSAWTITGESGSGKSRLLDEMQLFALSRGVRVLRGYASRADVRYALWREPLRRLVLEANLQDWDASVLKVIIPDIERLLKRRLPPFNTVATSATQQNLVEVICHLLQQQQRPLLLILEDTHAIDPDSRALLDEVCQHIADLPVLLLTSSQTTAAARASSLPLPPMSQGEAIALCESMLGKVLCDPRLLERIDARSAGNPFFIIEMLRVLAGETIAPLELPSLAMQVHEIVRRRLARIPLDAYPLLRIAAVMGMELDLNVLKFFHPGLDAWLYDCATAMILTVHDERWTFTHEKIREGVLNTMREEERNGVYRQLMVALEHTYANQPEFVPLISALRQKMAV